MTAPTLTLEQAREMGLHGRTFRNMRSKLPDWDTVAYTPSEMAAHGADHQTIVRAFLRPEVLGSGFGETVCQIAEVSLLAFEAARPNDSRPRDAIEAARRCFANPTAENKAAADQGARDAFRAAWEVGGFAVARAADVAGDAARAASGDADPGRAGRAGREDRAEWADWAAVYAEWAAKDAVEAGCPPATVLAIIEEAGQ